VAGRITVVGLGPGPVELLTVEATAAIAAASARFLRTARHPSASAVPGAASFDELYERADTFEEVYAGIVDALVAAAERHGEVLYAVPGSPLVAERTVELLRASGAELRILPALSFVDLAWDRLGVDPFTAGARLVDGHRFAVEAAGQTGPLLVGQCDQRHVLSAIKLAVDEDPGPVVVLQRLGLPDEQVTEVAWADLDRSVEPDHLTSVWIPGLASPVAADLVRLVELMEILRARCPWDREQTHRSLTRYLLEEAYEVIDAIDALPADDHDDQAAWSHLEEELGDLLFQVVFHARIGAEEGQFDLADVARGIHDKLVDRHPHVFAPTGEVSLEELSVTWEEQKKAEKGRGSVMDGIPSALPAAAYAEKVQRKAASLGLDWEDTAGVWAKVTEELGELREAVVTQDAAHQAAELGDVLFTVVNLARKLRIDAELALRGAANRVRRRVALVEEQAEAAGISPARAGAEQLDRWWEEAKARLAAED